MAPEVPQHLFHYQNQNNMRLSNMLLKNKETKKYSIQEAEEICIIDDLPIARAISQKVCEFVLPHIPIRTFDGVDSAISYLNQANPVKRTIFLDLEMPDKNGWDFLSIYTPKWFEHVYILTTSEDTENIQKASTFETVADYLIKPLQPEQMKYL